MFNSEYTHLLGSREYNWKQFHATMSKLENANTTAPPHPPSEAAPSNHDKPSHG
jgi:hypothetical protein